MVFIFLQVEVANSSHKTVHLGALRVGQKTSKTVKLVNHSPMDVTCLVNILPSSQELVFQDNVLTVTPKKEITLPGGGGVCPVTVNFAPTTRLQHFTEEVISDTKLMFFFSSNKTYTYISSWPIIPLTPYSGTCLIQSPMGPN